MRRVCGNCGTQVVGPEVDDDLTSCPCCGLKDWRSPFPYFFRPTADIKVEQDPDDPSKMHVNIVMEPVLKAEVLARLLYELYEKAAKAEGSMSYMGGAWESLPERNRKILLRVAEMLLAAGEKQ